MIALLLAQLVTGSIPSVVCRQDGMLLSCVDSDVFRLSISASIPAAVERTLSQLPEEDPARIALKLAELEAKLQNVEKVADLTASCIRAAFVWAGADLVSTAAGRRFCSECKEQNPLGFDDDLGLVGLKIGGLGSQVVTCYTSAKKGETPNKVFTWAIRILQGLAVATNSYSAISGKPLIRFRGAK